MTASLRSRWNACYEDGEKLVVLLVRGIAIATNEDGEKVNLNNEPFFSTRGVLTNGGLVGPLGRPLV